MNHPSPRVPARAAKARLGLVLASAALAACGPAQPITSVITASPSPSPVGVAEITDEAGRVYQIAQGVPGDPATVGCADGQREAFVDERASPAVAGCIGVWAERMSLRAPATGLACGDDLGPCGAPADACAPGWHVCGDDGRLAEIAAIGPDACERAGGGRFVAAISHCETQDGCATDDPRTGDYACFEQGWCSEPVCCGNDCTELGVCRDGIWPGRTHIPVGVDQGCGSIGASRARGVMCCRDGSVAP